MPNQFNATDAYIEDDRDQFFHRQELIHNEGDLMALASTLFMRNSIKWDGADGELTVYPYTKSVINPELGLQYGRMVRLLSFGVDKNNNPAYRFETSWEAASDSRISGSVDRLRYVFTPSLPPMEIGSAYHYRSSFISKDRRTLFRVKSADICISGTIEYVKAKKKERRALLSGRLAVSKSLGT